MRIHKNNMKTIYKYNLELGDDTQSLSLPKGAKILTVQIQGNYLCLWALVDKEAEEYESRTILICDTCHDAGECTAEHYIATVQVGIFVWHIFERP